MKTTIKNVISILILMNTINLFSQKGKQEIMYREPSRFTESSLVTETVEISQVPSSQIDKADIDLKEIIKKNNIVGLQLAVVEKGKIMKTINYGLANIQDSILVDSKTVFNMNSIAKTFTGVVSVVIFINSEDFQSEDYLESIAKLYIVK